MRKIHFLALAVMLALTALSTSAQKMAYGYTMPPSTTPAMISFNLEAPTTATVMGTYSKAETRSGALAKSTLYMMGIDDDFYTWFYTMDPNTGESQTIKKLGEITIPCDMSFDYSTETMYSIANSETVDGVSALSTVNLTTGNITCVNTDLGYSVKAIAIDARGQMYMLTKDGDLLKVNKSNGENEVIGNTGVKMASYWNFQSMEFDRENGILYLAAWTNQDKTMLYTIDTTTGAATLVGDIGDGTHAIALSIPYEPAAGTAPDRVKDLEVVADKSGKLKATVSWTNPTMDYNGNPLEGNIIIEFTSSATGVKEVIENCVPGETMSREETVPAAGMYTYTLVAVNAAGASLENQAEAWIGPDVPAAVGNATAKLNPNELMVNDITWEAPVTGAHGGYINKVLTKYDIVRLNDGEIIAQNLTSTKFSDKKLLQGLTRYSYQIIAKNSSGEGDAAKTNDLVNGPAVKCPYVAPFNSWEESGQYWTVLDGNDDKYPFVWYNDFMNMFGQGENKGYYIYQKHDVFYAYDFIISPPIEFTEGHEYKITATVSNDDIAGYREESFRFYNFAGYDLVNAIPLGNESFKVKHPKEFRDYSITFKVEDDGYGASDETYPSFIALCCNSQYDMGMLLVSSISIEDLTPSAPIHGDVNGDGEVTIGDVNALIDIILSGRPNLEADINDDGELSIGDINALINIILS